VALTEPRIFGALIDTGAGGGSIFVVLVGLAGGYDVVWVEGTGIIRRELAALIDASIYVQGDLAAQEQRLVARDGDIPEQQEHIARWLDEELPFMAREQPWARATVVVAGTSQIEHDPAQPVIHVDRFRRPQIFTHVAHWSSFRTAVLR